MTGITQYSVIIINTDSHSSCFVCLLGWQHGEWERRTERKRRRQREVVSRERETDSRNQVRKRVRQLLFCPHSVLGVFTLLNSEMMWSNVESSSTSSYCGCKKILIFSVLFSAVMFVIVMFCDILKQYCTKNSETRTSQSYNQKVPITQPYLVLLFILYILCYLYALLDYLSFSCFIIINCPCKAGRCREKWERARAGRKVGRK